MVTVERQSHGSFLSNSPYKADDVDRDLISLPFGRIPEPEEVVFTQVMIPRSIRQLTPNLLRYATFACSTWTEYSAVFVLIHLPHRTSILILHDKYTPGVPLGQCW